MKCMNIYYIFKINISISAHWQLLKLKNIYVQNFPVFCIITVEIHSFFCNAWVQHLSIFLYELIKKLNGGGGNLDVDCIGKAQRIVLVIWTTVFDVRMLFL